jgi:hypothetical protein
MRRIQSNMDPEIPKLCNLDHSEARCIEGNAFEKPRKTTYSGSLVQPPEKTIRPLGLRTALTSAPTSGNYINGKQEIGHECRSSGKPQCLSIEFHDAFVEFRPLTATEFTRNNCVKRFGCKFLNPSFVALPNGPVKHATLAAGSDASLRDTTRASGPFKPVQPNNSNSMTAGRKFLKLLALSRPN